MTEEERIRAQQRARRARRAQMKKKRRQRQMIIIAAELAVVLILLIIILATCAGGKDKNPDATEPPVNDAWVEDTSGATEPVTEDTTPTEPEPTWMTFPQEREILAQQYFVYSCDEEAFPIISGDIDERIYPASVTKLFTAYIAMQYLEPTDTVVAGDALELVAPGSSVAEIQEGDELTVEMLVEAMLLPSGNDAAYILAAEAGRVMDGKPDENASTAAKSFVAEMNKQAKELGMTGTNFANPDGIHRETHYTTFKDLSIMGALAMENETIMKYAVTSHKDVELGGKEVQWKNTNELIVPESQYYCPYAVGLKTGQTPYAGSCLLSAFEYEGESFIIGVFGCPETEDRFADTLQLFNETLDIN